MNAKHTPGNWIYNPDFSAVVVIHDYKVKAVADFGKTDLPETEDNARLISAAPELLSALEGVTRILEAFGYTTALGKTQMARMDAARAAIAKAKGGA